MNLTYTNEDDGIHVTCDECEADYCLGHSATVQQAIEVEQEHEFECPVRRA